MNTQQQAEAKRQQRRERNRRNWAKDPPKVTVAYNTEIPKPSFVEQSNYCRAVAKWRYQFRKQKKREHCWTPVGSASCYLYVRARRTVSDTAYHLEQM